MIDRPACPLCDAPMNPASDLVTRGRVSYWLCSDRTCSGILAAEDVRAEDPLGAPEARRTVTARTRPGSPELRLRLPARLLAAVQARADARSPGRPGGVSSYVRRLLEEDLAGPVATPAGPGPAPEADREALLAVADADTRRGELLARGARRSRPSAAPWPPKANFDDFSLEPQGIAHLFSGS